MPLLNPESPEFEYARTHGTASLLLPPVVKATMPPNNPFPARRASDRSQCSSICGLAWRFRDATTLAWARARG
eukprot:12246723-Alexandrium_andersonii.AAC.1